MEIFTQARILDVGHCEKIEVFMAGLRARHARGAKILIDRQNLMSKWSKVHANQAACCPASRTCKSSPTSVRRCKQRDDVKTREEKQTRTVISCLFSRLKTIAQVEVKRTFAQWRYHAGKMYGLMSFKTELLSQTTSNATKITLFVRTSSVLS